MWQMLGACGRTLILCGTEWNLHIWHWAFLPPPPPLPFVLWVYVTRCGPTTNLIKMRRCDCLFARVCVWNAARVCGKHCTYKAIWLFVRVLCVLHVHGLILWIGSLNRLISRLHVSVVNPSVSQGTPSHSFPSSSSPASCHPLITTSTDGSFYFPTEY